MSSIFDTTTNYSFYTIPVGWILCLAPHIYATQLAGKKFDNKSPRSMISSLQNDQSIDSKTKGRITRAEAAQQNGFENIGLFAAAVAAGNAAGLPASTLNLYSFSYILSRVAYTMIYINNETESLANVRSLVFVGGVGMIMTMFVKAGNKMASFVGRA